MEYYDITPTLVDELNEAVKKDSAKDFFEALGFDIYDCDEERWEMSGVHTKSGVEMIVVVDKDNWIESFEEYYVNFDVDEEIAIHREDPNGSYCKRFTCRDSVEDFEDWDDYIQELVDIAKAKGKYKYRKHLPYTNVKKVLVIDVDFPIKELDNMDDEQLFNWHLSNMEISEIFEIEDFETLFNQNLVWDGDFYIKFLGE